jgi:hypothetical protein
MFLFDLLCLSIKTTLVAVCFFSFSVAHVSGPFFHIFFIFIFIFLFIYSHVHTLGHFSTLSPPPPFPLSPPQFQAGPILPLSLILLKKGHMHNKKDKACLLVELRIAVQKDSAIAFMYPCFMTHVNSTLTDLYLGS